MRTDNEIQKDVMAELKWEPQLNASEIGVAVKDGVVTLSGTVDSYLKKLAAEQAAKRVKNVKAVAMDIEVHFGYEIQRTDAEVAAAVLSALKWNSAVPDDKIQVKVDNGWVTLEGELRWQYQKSAAADAVHSLTGVRGVTNSIRLLPAANAVLVRDSIRRALERSADVEAAGINIETSGSRVTLKGKVHSWSERNVARQAAWSSPGVTAVEDDLQVSS